MFGESAFALGLHPLIVLLLALALDAYIGDPPGVYRLVPHPVALMGRIAGGLERRLNRPARSGATRRMRGAFMVLALVGLAAFAGWAIARLGRAVPFGWLVELLVAMTLVAQHDLYRRVRAVAVALEDGGLEAGREALRHIGDRNPATLDAFGVARGAIESCAGKLSGDIVAPVFWYVLLGLPGMLAYKIVDTLDRMIGHRSPRYREFGATAARLDDAIAYIPARITALIIAAAAAFVPSASPPRAFRAMLRDAGRHRSLNAGWPEAAMAGALDLALAGPRRYGDAVVKDAWMGSGRARAEPYDIRRALYVFLVACLIDAGLVALLALAQA